MTFPGCKEKVGGMARQKNAAPVIIKRKKVVAGEGHHGGAWKVAYADFVTAMMAFFMLMWLLNATTEKQRKGIADYFSPTIPLSRVSGGGDGSFGGDSVFSEDQIAQNGTGASSLKPSVERQAKGQTGTDTDKQARETAFTEDIRKIEEALMGTGGESVVSERAARHIVTRVTDEGMIVELYDLDEEPLFLGDTDRPAPILEEMSGMLARVFALTTNSIAVDGYIPDAAGSLARQPRMGSLNRAGDAATHHSGGRRSAIGPNAARYRPRRSQANRKEHDGATKQPDRGYPASLRPMTSRASWMLGQC